MKRKKEDQKLSKITEKSRRHKESEYTVDSFDLDVVVNNEIDKCVLCKNDHQFGLLMKERLKEHHADVEEVQDSDTTVLDVEGVWASKFSLDYKGKRRVFVHYHCALFSPQTQFTGVTWINLRKEVSRSASLKCHHCGLSGATIGCLIRNCSYVVHLSCAIKISDYGMAEHVKDFLCPQHLEERRRSKFDAEQLVTDLSKGLEPNPINVSTFSLDIICRPCRDDTKSIPSFYYASALMDGDNLNITQPCVGGLSCCDCDGRCDDVATCSCLAFSSKSYTYAGTLIPDLEADHIILECNERCSCSIRRCTNRVVGKGLPSQLEVFKVSAKKGCNGEFPSESKEVELGVRTLDPIPKHSFVCELTGQLSYGHATDQFPILSESSEREPTLTESVMNGANVCNEYQHNSFRGKVFPVCLWEDRTIYKFMKQPNECSTWDDEMIATLERNGSTRSTMLPDGAVLLKGTESDKPLTTDNSVSVSKVSSQMNTVRKLLDKTIFLDCRRYSNVGSFIRHQVADREYQNKLPLGNPLEKSTSHSSADRTDSQARNNTPSPTLLRKFVYFDRKDLNKRKLALFAVSDIAANSELFL